MGQRSVHKVFGCAWFLRALSARGWHGFGAGGATERQEREGVKAAMAGTGGMKLGPGLGRGDQET